jgi:hypothetical protein
MKPYNDFLITPVGGRYNNIKAVGDKQLIINTEIANFKTINRKGLVLQEPSNRNTEIKKGDEVIVHHNVFRRWHNMHGEEKNSRSYLSEKEYLVSDDQIFLYKRNNSWKALDGYCFVQPIKDNDKLSLDKEKPLVGIIKFVDKTLAKQEVQVGDLVGFSPNDEYEFLLEGRKMYRVRSKFITIKYEYQGDEEEYNPSWA